MIFMFGMSLGVIAIYLDPLNLTSLLVANAGFYGLIYLCLIEISQSTTKVNEKEVKNG